MCSGIKRCVFRVWGLDFGVCDGDLPGAMGLQGCVYRAASQASRCVFRARGRHCGVEVFKYQESCSRWSGASEDS